jgi:hypothetical protein
MKRLTTQTPISLNTGATRSPSSGSSYSRSHQNLAGLLMNQAQRDDALHRSLLFKVERASGSIDILKSFRKATAELRAFANSSLGMRRAVLPRIWTNWSTPWRNG